MNKIVLQQVQHNPERSRRVGLVIDEGADLPKEIIEKYQIAVVPVKMDWPEIENLPGGNTFQKMREAEKQGIKSFGKTSQPSPKDFLNAFKKQLERFDKIICITLTSKLSGTYNSACQAKNILGSEGEKIFIIDSLNATCGEALSDLRAIDLIEAGKGAEEISEDLEAFRPKIVLRGILKDPKWLEASGRISSTIANWVRKMEKLGLRPLIGIKKGVIKAVGIKAGAKDIPTALFKEFEGRIKSLLRENKKIRTTITHGDNLEAAQKLKEMLESNFKGTEVAFINLIDNVLGVLLGPDALILAWCEIT